MFHLPYTLLYPPHMLFQLPHTSFTHYLTLFIQYFCILVVGWQVWLWCGLWGLVVVAMVIAVSPKKIQNIIWFAHEKHTKKDLELYLASLDKQEFKKLLWNFKMTMPLFSSWVKSADVEKPEWLSKVITHLWPPISVYIEKHLRLVVEPKINDYLKKWKIFTFKFKTMREPSGEPEILGVKVYDKTPSKDVILEVHFTYTGNFRFSASNTKLEFGTTHIQITGSARIILKHLLPHPPFVGHVRIVPITSPDVNIHFRGVANWPIISKNLIDSVKEAISWSYDLSLDENALSVEEYKSPTPEGVISLRVTGNDEVDSCIIRQGSNIFRGCKPWTSVFEVICYSHVRERGIVLEIEADDHIYSDQLDIEDIIKEKYLTKHYRVADNLHSFFSTEATWFELTNDAVMLTEQWQEGEDQARRTQSCAVLKVWLDYAEIFVFDQKLDIRLKVGGKSKQMSSSLVYSNGQEGIRIEFEEGIDFLIADPQKQKLKIQILGNIIQETEKELSFLLNEPHMKSAQLIEFNTGENIFVHLTLYILKPVRKYADNGSYDEHGDNLSANSESKESLTSESASQSKTIASVYTDLEYPVSCAGDSGSPNSETNPFTMTSENTCDNSGPVVSSVTSSSTDSGKGFPFRGSYHVQEGLGKIKLGIRYGQKSHLNITILDTKILQRERGQKTSSAVWKARLIRMNGSKQKIKIKSRADDELHFEHQIACHELCNYILVLTSWNKSKRLSRQPTSQVKLRFRNIEINKPINQWYNLESPNESGMIYWVGSDKTIKDEI